MRRWEKPTTIIMFGCLLIVSGMLTINSTSFGYNNYNLPQITGSSPFCPQNNSVYGVDFNSNSVFCREVISSGGSGGSDGNVSSICGGQGSDLVMLSNGSCQRLNESYELKSTSGSTTFKFSGSKLMIKVT